MVYQWKTGSRFKTDANVAAEVMNELAKEGKLNAEQLVEVSRPADAPLHDEFEWDDAKAAEEWRKQTGRVMIASITFVMEETRQQEPYRAFYHLVREEKEYTPIEVIMKDSQKTEQLLKVALSELIAFQKKYSGIKEFEAIYREIGRLEQTYMKLDQPKKPVQIYRPQTKVIASAT